MLRKFFFRFLLLNLHLMRIVGQDTQLQIHSYRYTQLQIHTATDTHSFLHFLAGAHRLLRWQLNFTIEVDGYPLENVIHLLYGPHGLVYKIFSIFQNIRIFAVCTTLLLGRNAR